jgi:hypothetical protein
VQIKVWRLLRRSLLGSPRMQVLLLTTKTLSYTSRGQHHREVFVLPCPSADGGAEVVPQAKCTAPHSATKSLHKTIVTNFGFGRIAVGDSEVSPQYSSYAWIRNGEVRWVTPRQYLIYRSKLKPGSVFADGQFERSGAAIVCENGGASVLSATGERGVAKGGKSNYFT